MTARLVRTLALGGPPAVVCVTLALAWGTLQPGVGFWDTAEFQTVLPLMGTLHPTGFPAYTLIGWFASVVLQPLGAPAYRENVLSALCVAGAAGLTVVLVRQLTGRTVVAIAAGLLLFLTDITWYISTHADVHSLHLLLFAIVLNLLVGWEARERDPSGPRPGADRWLIAAAIAYGVAAANHSLVLLAAPAIAFYVLAVAPGILERPGFIVRCAAAVGLTTVLLYLELPLRAGPFRAELVYGHPETPAGFVYVALGQQFSSGLSSPLAGLDGKLGGLARFAAAQLGILAAALPIAAAATIGRRWRYALLTGPTLAITCLFAMSYTNAEIERYYLGPLLIVVTWLAILADVLLGLIERVVGADSEQWWSPRRGTGRSAAPPAGIVAVEVVLATLLLLPAVLGAATTRALVDRSHETQAQQWIDTTLPRLAPDAVVISWWSYSTTLWYARDIEGLRPDVTIIDDRTRLDQNLGDVAQVIDSYLGQRPVYILRQGDETAQLGARYRILPMGDQSGLSEVVERRTTAP